MCAWCAWLGQVNKRRGTGFTLERGGRDPYASEDAMGGGEEGRAQEDELADIIKDGVDEVRVDHDPDWTLQGSLGRGQLGGPHSRPTGRRVRFTLASVSLASGELGLARSCVLACCVRAALLSEQGVGDILRGEDDTFGESGDGAGPEGALTAAQQQQQEDANALEITIDHIEARVLNRTAGERCALTAVPVCLRARVCTSWWQASSGPAGASAR